MSTEGRASFVRGARFWNDASPARDASIRSDPILTSEFRSHSPVTLRPALFYIASDNLDVRFRTRLDLSMATLVAAIKFGAPVGANAIPNDGSSVAFKNLDGKLDFEMVARLGEAGTGGVSIPVAHVPMFFNIPVIINGIPFIAQVAADFLVKVGLSGKHAAQHFHARFAFNGGGGGFAATATSQSDTNFNLSGDEPEIEVTEASLSAEHDATLERMYQKDRQEYIDRFQESYWASSSRGSALVSVCSSWQPRWASSIRSSC